MKKQKFALWVFCLMLNHLLFAQKTEIFITVTQNCVNCNIIKKAYEELSKTYTVKLIFEEKLKQKEIDAYFTEIIKLPKSTPYIQSDSLWQKLGNYAGGSYLYVVKENNILYTCNLKYYQYARINGVVNSNAQEKKSIKLPDDVSLVHFSDAICNFSNYYLLNTSLNKIYIFDLTTLKLQKILNENSFDMITIWKSTFRDTTGIHFAKEVLRQYQERVPDQKMFKLEQIDICHDTLLIWGSIFTPKLQKNTAQTTVVMERSDVILWYKDNIHRIESVVLPDSLKDCYLASGLGSIRYRYPNLYVPINVSAKSTRKKYMYAHYLLQKNEKPLYMGFDFLEMPQQNKMNFMNSFKLNDSCLFFNAFPYYYNFISHEMNRIDFLAPQNISVNTLLQSWFIHYASIKQDTQEFSMIIKLTDNKRYYISIDNNNILKEKILLTLPFSIPSYIVVHQTNMIYISEDKESIILHKLP